MPRLFGRSGALPTFLVIGAQKAGTTSLADLLCRHPDIGMAAVKEVHYFDDPRGHARGLAWYRSRFARVARSAARFEATPAYLYVPCVPGRIAAELPPSVRFVAILRHPVDRAYSHYWHGRRVGAVAGSFEDTLREEPSRLGQPGDAWWALADRGRYYRQLRRFCEAVGRERLLVVLFDDLVRDAPGTADRIAAFVGVRPLGASWGPLPHAHQARRRLAPPAWLSATRHPLTRTLLSGRVRRGLQLLMSAPFVPPPMDPATRAALVDAFRADNDALAAWLGRDLSAWSR